MKLITLFENQHHQHLIFHQLIIHRCQESSSTRKPISKPSNWMITLQVYQWIPVVLRIQRYRSLFLITSFAAPRSIPEKWYGHIRIMRLESQQRWIRERRDSHL